MSAGRHPVLRFACVSPTHDIVGSQSSKLLSTQLLQDNYGITLEGATPDDTEAQQQQSPRQVEVSTSAQHPPAALSQLMQHQATQTEQGSAAMPQLLSSAIETCADIDPAPKAEADPAKGDEQQTPPASGDPASPHQKQIRALSMELEQAPRPLTDLPAAVPARAAKRRVNGPLTPGGSMPAVQAHEMAETHPA